MDIEKPPPLKETATRFMRAGQTLRQLGGRLRSRRASAREREAS